MQPIITIFCAFTRRWALDKWLENLSDVEHDPALTNLCFIVDCDDTYIAEVLEAYARNHNYRSFHVKTNENWHPNEVRLSVRRMRVAEVKNQSKELIAKTDGDIVIGLEDDTVFDRMTSFAQLYEPLLTHEDVAFVEGVQMGRWGANIIGAWKADNPQLPTKIKTLLPPQQPVLQYITGGGFYGYATRKFLYLEHDYYWATSQPWGPDVNYGFWLRNKGYKCMINWELIFGHNDWGGIMYPDALPPRERLAQIVYTKDNNTTKWERADYEPTRY